MAKNIEFTPEMRNELRKLYAEGAAYDEIGKKFGVSRGTISGLVYRMGLVNRKSPVDRMGRANRRAPVEIPETKQYHVNRITLPYVPPPRSLDLPQKNQDQQHKQQSTREPADVHVAREPTA